MYIIAGLGNPGAEYDFTPHNVGFAVVDRLASRFGVHFRRNASGLAHEASHAGTSRIVLLKPHTYMNRSGSAVRAAMDFYKCALSDLLVICDDVNLPSGHMRFRDGGGAGGQKGLVSIIQSLGSEQFTRLRLGVGGGHPGANIANHVLRKVSGESRVQYEQMIETAAAAVECLIGQGLSTAMNQYNTKKEKAAKPDDTGLGDAGSI